MIKPDQRFKDDFMLAMEFYEVSKEEAQQERDWALKDEENYYHSAKSYSIIAAGIRGLTPHQPDADKIGE